MRRNQPIWAARPVGSARRLRRRSTSATSRSKPAQTGAEGTDGRRRSGSTSTHSTRRDGQRRRAPRLGADVHGRRRRRRPSGRCRRPPRGRGRRSRGRGGGPGCPEPPPPRSPASWLGLCPSWRSATAPNSSPPSIDPCSPRAGPGDRAEHVVLEGEEGVLADHLEAPQAGPLEELVPHAGEAALGAALHLHADHHRVLDARGCRGTCSTGRSPTRAGPSSHSRASTSWIECSSIVPAPALDGSRAPGGAVHPLHGQELVVAQHRRLHPAGARVLDLVLELEEGGAAAQHEADLVDHARPPPRRRPSPARPAERGGERLLAEHRQAPRRRPAATRRGCSLVQVHT